MPYVCVWFLLSRRSLRVHLCRLPRCCLLRFYAPTAADALEFAFLFSCFLYASFCLNVAGGFAQKADVDVLARLLSYLERALNLRRCGYSVLARRRFAFSVIQRIPVPLFPSLDMACLFARKTSRLHIFLLAAFCIHATAVCIAFVIGFGRGRPCAVLLRFCIWRSRAFAGSIQALASLLRLPTTTTTGRRFQKNCYRC